MNTTAGVCQLIRRSGKYMAQINLSIKVVDREVRLQNTLCHEMCHAAAWLVNKISKPPHGREFKGYAARAMRAFPHLSIATCHSYEIEFKCK